MASSYGGFFWYPGNGNDEPVKFRFFLRDVTSGDTLVNDEEKNLSYGMSGLLVGHTYEWRVKAVSTVDTSEYTSTGDNNPNFIFTCVDPQANAIQIRPLPSTSFCASNTLKVPFQYTGFDASSGFYGNIGSSLKLMLSDEQGSFDQPYLFYYSITTNDTVAVTLPSTIKPGSGYRVRIMVQTYNGSYNQFKSGFTYYSEPSEPFEIKAFKPFSIVDAAGNTRYGGFCAGKSIPLKVSFGEGVEIPQASYQWMRNGAAIPGATNVTYTATEEGAYTVTRQVGTCAAQTSLDYVTYNSFGVAAFIQKDFTEPLCQGNEGILRATYVTSSATYAWYRNDTLLTTPANQPYLVATKGGTYGMTVTDAGCGTRTTTTTVLFLPGLLFTISDWGYTLCSAQYNGRVLLRQGNTYPGGVFFQNANYQWFRNNQPIEKGTQNQLLTFKGGDYHLRVKQGQCEGISNTVHVDSGGMPKPILIAQFNPTSRHIELCPNESTTLYVENQFLPAEYYVWKKEGLVVAEGYRLYAYEAQGPGTYSVGAYSSSIAYQQGYCGAESDPIVVTYRNQTQVRIIQSAEECFKVRGKTLFYQAPNQAPRTRQWYRNGELIPGATETTYEVPQAGTYHLRTENQAGCVGLSDSIVVSENQKFTFPGRILAYGGTDRCAGNGVLLAFEQNIPPYGYRYTWKRNGQPIPGANQYHLEVFESGDYTFMARFDTCWAESAPIPVRIGEPVTATLSGDTVLFSGVARLPVQLTGLGPFTIRMSDGSTSLAQVTSYTHSVAPAQTTTYTLAQVKNPCGTGLTSGSATVTVGIYSVQSGDWQDPATWSCGCVPTAEAEVEIRSGHVVNLTNGTGRARNLWYAGGTLALGGAGQLVLNQ